MKQFYDTGGYLPPESLPARGKEHRMSRIGRALMLSGCLVLASGILMAGTPPCSPVTMSVGNAATSGTVQFTLAGNDASLYTVQVSVAAGDTAMTIAAKIDAAVGLNGP